RGGGRRGRLLPRRRLRCVVALAARDAGTSSLASEHDVDPWQRRALVARPAAGSTRGPRGARGGGLGRRDGGGVVVLAPGAEGAGRCPVRARVASLGRRELPGRAER